MYYKSSKLINRVTIFNKTMDVKSNLLYVLKAKLKHKIV